MGKPVEVEFIGKDKSLSNTIDTAESKSRKLGSTLGGVTKIAALGLAGAVVGVGFALKNMAENAKEDETGQRRLAVALHNATGATQAQDNAVENWISKQGVALGVTDDELRPALQRLVQATHNVGEAEKEASVAMDASAGSGKSLKTVSEAIAKAHNGNLGALSRLGIAIKDNTGKTLTFNQVMKNMAATFKDQASTAANSTAGQFDRLKLIMDETKESIGYKVLPVMTFLATFMLNTVIPTVSHLSSVISTKLTPILHQLSAHIQTKIIPAFQQAAAWAKQNLVPALTSIGTFIVTKVVPALARLYDWMFTKLAPAVARALVPILNGLRSVFEQVRAAVDRNSVQLDKTRVALQRVAEFVITKVLPVLAKLVGYGLKTVAPMIGTLIDGFAKWVTAVDNVVGAVQSLIGWLGRIHVPDALSKVAHLAGSVVGKVPGFANGGITPGGVVRVGERGPENVILPRGSRVIPSNRSMGGGSGGTAHAIVDLRIGGHTIEKLLIEWQRDNGGRPLQISTI